MKKIGVCILALLFLVPLVVAVDINVKTLPEHRVSIIIREAGKLVTAESFHKDTGAGDVSVNSGVGLSYIDLLVTLKKDGKVIINKKFQEISTSAPININFMSESEAGIVDSFEEKVEEVVEEKPKESRAEIVKESEEKITDESKGDVVKREAQESGPSITGAAISNVKGIFTSKTIYYIIGGILVVSILFFVVFVAKEKLGSSEIKNFSVRDYDKRLSNAEGKLDSAKKELDALKNRKRRLEEAREKFKKDQEELKKMEKDY